jgi:hypothetical protein
VNETAAVVPFAPMTSIGNVIVEDTEACRVTLAVARTVEEFFAVTVTVV